jgi:hypothetical protein
MICIGCFEYEAEYVDGHCEACEWAETARALEGYFEDWVGDETE